MPLMCHCPESDDATWWFWPPSDYVTADPKPKRRKRCCSCRQFIEHGAICAKFRRTRDAMDDIEMRIHGEGAEAVALAPWWLCERCADLYFSLEDLGFCVSPEEDMRELVREYAAIYGPKVQRKEGVQT